MNHDTIAKLIDAQMEAYYNGDYMDSSDARGQLLEFANLVIAAEREKRTKIEDDIESALEALVSYCNNVDLGWIDEVVTAEDALGAAKRARRQLRSFRALSG